MSLNLGRLTYELKDGQVLQAKPLMDIKEAVNKIASAVEDIDQGSSESSQGEKGDSPINCYKWFEKNAIVNKPTSRVREPDGWSKNAPNMPTDTNKTWYLWMSQSIWYGDGTIDEWSTPVRISGEDGDNGTDSKSREWIYSYSNTGYNGNVGTVNGNPLPSGKNKFQVDDFVPNGWEDRALSVEDNSGKRTVYASYRDYNTTNKLWGEFQEPIVWSHWGEQGLDGDGVQYIYKLYPEEITEESKLESYKPKKTSQNENGEWLPVTRSASDPNLQKTWTDDPETPTANFPYCYCSVIKQIDGEWGDYGRLSLWAKYSKDGIPGSSPINCYKWFAIGTEPEIPENDTEHPETPIDPNDEQHPWSKYAPDREANKHLWMSSNTKNGNGTVTERWSKPVRISGDNGDAGSDEKNREWIYNYSPLFDTTKGGEISPQEAANDSISRDDSHDVDDWVPYGWYDRALPVSQKNKDVYTSWRDRNASTGKWEDFNDPFVWSHWGEDGMDGDGVQYIYKLFPRELTPTELNEFIPGCPDNQNNNGEWLPAKSKDNISNKSWTDNPETTSEEFPYCYCSIIKYDGSQKKWGTKDSNGTFKDKRYGTLSLWSRFSEDSVVYTINCTDIVKPGDDYISVSITRSKGEDIQTKDLEQAKTDWKVYLTTSFGTIEESDSQINLEGENITTTTSIILTLHKDSTSGKVVASKTIRGLQDGAQGKTGKMFYQAGVWRADDETYTSTDELCPIVYHNNKYYYLDFPTSKNEEPGVNVHWKLVDKFGVVMTEALFADFAKLGSFVVTGDFFISQYGRWYRDQPDQEQGNYYYVPQDFTEYDGKPCYTYFRASDPDGTIIGGEYPKFIPTKCVNALTGEEWMGNGKLHVDNQGSLFISGPTISLTNGSLEMVGDGYRVALEQGLMAFFGSNGVMNIQLGVDDNGCAVLKFYDKDGNFKYDLGPDSIHESLGDKANEFKKLEDLKAADLTEIQTHGTVRAQLYANPNPYISYYKFIEGYAYLNEVKEYNVSGTTSPSNWNNKVFDSNTQSSTSSNWIPTGNKIQAGYYIEREINISGQLYRCNVYLVSLEGGIPTYLGVLYYKVTNDIVMICDSEGNIYTDSTKYEIIDYLNGQDPKNGRPRT